MTVAPRKTLPLIRLLAVPLLSLVFAGAATGGATPPPKKGTGKSVSDPKPAERLDSQQRAEGSHAGTSPSPDSSDRLGTGETASFNPPAAISLKATVPAGGATNAWLRRFLADPSRTVALRKAHGGRLPGPGGSLRIPLAELNDDYRFKVVRDLFPADSATAAGWSHRVGAGRLKAAQESLDLLARAYTGGPENAGLLEQLNAAAGKGLPPGREIAIPTALLHPAFVRGPGSQTAATTTRADGAPPLPSAPLPVLAALGPASAPVDNGQDQEPDTAASSPPTQTTPPTEPHAPEDDFTEAPAGAEGEEEGPTLETPGPFAPPPMAPGANELVYSADSEGRYAVYRLKKGEALYSAVVVRFTGRIDVQEVNDLAGQIARRSGIEDVTNIKIGFKIKIPIDALLAEYQPRDDPRRQAWERKQAEVARYTNMATSRGLQGVAVILDAGHGGRDVGAAHNGVWEHDYVYDIMCRIKALLETQTGARVLPTIKDMKEGFTIHDSTRLARSQAEALLTNPPFQLTGRAPSVNLRWYLSNSYFRRLVDEGIDPLKIVFTSLHADARHPSLAGAMVYVPGEEFRRGRYGHSDAVYARYREAREEPFVAFTRDERERSEGLSRQFAAALIVGFGSQGVSVNPYQPVREQIIRKGRAWVPAVLRCNVVPVEVLIEVANLSNPADSKAIADPAYRQRVAQAYVNSLQAYFSGPSHSRPRMEPRAGR